MKITRRQLRKIIKEELIRESRSGFDIPDRVTGTTLNTEQLFNEEINPFLDRAMRSAFERAKGEVQAKHITDAIDAIATTAAFANESLDDADTMAFDLAKMALSLLSTGRRGSESTHSRQITQAREWNELGNILKHILRSRAALQSFRDPHRWRMSDEMSHDLSLKMWRIGNKVKSLVPVYDLPGSGEEQDNGDDDSSNSDSA